MRTSLLLVLAAMTIASGARAERLTVALSTPDVRINSNFTGTALTIFGVIERNAEAISRAAEYQVAVALIGPAETAVARRKDRFLGIWANGASQTIVGAPSFYSMSSTVKPDVLAPPGVLSRLQIGFDNLAFRYEGDPRLNDPAFKDFRDAFIRLKERERLYNEQVGVSFIGDLIFRTTLFLPANIPVGPYIAEAYLFSGQALVGRARDGLVVSKIGLEDRLFTFAKTQSLAYGLLSVLSALVIGWLGGVIFRRD